MLKPNTVILLGEMHHGDILSKYGPNIEEREVSTIRLTSSVSKREGGAHAGPHLVPVPVAEMGDDGQFRVVRCEHVRSEIRFGANTGQFPLHENTIRGSGL